MEKGLRRISQLFQGKLWVRSGRGNYSCRQTLFVCIFELIAVNNEIQVCDSKEAVILKLNIFESLQPRSYVRLNAMLGLIMMKCTNSKLHIDSINICGCAGGMKSFQLIGRKSFRSGEEFSPLGFSVLLSSSVCPVCLLSYFTERRHLRVDEQDRRLFQAIWIMSDIKTADCECLKCLFLDSVQMAAACISGWALEHTVMST